MTLADVLPIAQQLTPPEKLRLIRILAEELDPVAGDEPALAAGHSYFIYTPLDLYGAAQTLLDAFPDIHVPGPDAASQP